MRGGESDGTIVNNCRGSKDFEDQRKHTLHLGLPPADPITEGWKVSTISAEGLRSLAQGSITAGRLDKGSGGVTLAEKLLYPSGEDGLLPSYSENQKLRNSRKAGYTRDRDETREI